MSAQTPATLNQDSDAAQLVTKTILLNDGSVETKRQEILDYFHNTFSLYESIFECLNGDAAFYERAKPHDMPFVIRETSRKFQHSSSQMSVWEKKA